MIALTLSLPLPRFVADRKRVKPLTTIVPETRKAAVRNKTVGRVLPRMMMPAAPSRVNRYKVARIIEMKMMLQRMLFFT